ncbi:hypothetical protein E5289_11115 [Lactiplantibacillus pentosus]
MLFNISAESFNQDLSDSLMTNLLSARNQQPFQSKLSPHMSAFRMPSLPGSQCRTSLQQQVSAKLAPFPAVLSWRLLTLGPSRFKFKKSFANTAAKL